MRKNNLTKLETFLKQHSFTFSYNNHHTNDLTIRLNTISYTSRFNERTIGIFLEPKNNDVFKRLFKTFKHNADYINKTLYLGTTKLYGQKRP